MKPANGGVLHALFDHSHPRLLGGKPSHKSIPSSRPAAKNAPPDPRRTVSVAESAENYPAESGGVPSTNKPPGGGADGGTSGDGSALLGLGGRRLGLRLPRSLVVHGTADATVPFVQTATVGAALKALGVPTIVRFEPGGKEIDYDKRVANLHGRLLVKYTGTSTWYNIGHGLQSTFDLRDAGDSCRRTDSSYL